MLVLMVVFWFIGIGLSMLTFFLRLLGINYPRTDGNHRNSSNSGSNTKASAKPRQQKKVFSDNEGEYIDFEEL